MHDKDVALTLKDNLAHRKSLLFSWAIQTPNMSPSLVRIDANEPVEKILDVIERDGGVIVTNFLSQELLQESMDTSEFGI
jgi:hypothetical protein